LTITLVNSFVNKLIEKETSFSSFKKQAVETRCLHYQRRIRKGKWSMDATALWRGNSHAH